MRALARNPRELALTLRILAVAALVPALMRLRLGRLEAVLEPRRARRDLDEEAAERLARRVDDVLAAGRPFLRPGCLTRGVTLYYFLRRAGADVELVFGMGKPDDGFAGHCWLVKEGEPYLERTDPRPLFTPMHTIPRPARASGS